MRFRVLVIGKPSLGYAKAGIAEYLPRLQRFGHCEVEFLKASGRDEEGRILMRRSEGMFRVVMDERGAQWTSRAFSEWLGRVEDEVGGGGEVAFLVGGADGHSEEVRRSARQLIALGAMTMQHELALVVLLEQLYRARTLRAGLPYHRD